MGRFEAGHIEASGKKCKHRDSSTGAICGEPTEEGLELCPKHYVNY
jgi:hypothetical protein